MLWMMRPMRYAAPAPICAILRPGTAPAGAPAGPAPPISRPQGLIHCFPPPHLGVQGTRRARPRSCRPGLDTRTHGAACRVASEDGAAHRCSFECEQACCRTTRMSERRATDVLTCPTVASQMLLNNVQPHWPHSQWPSTGQMIMKSSPLYRGIVRFPVVPNSP